MSAETVLRPAALPPTAVQPPNERAAEAAGPGGVLDDSSTVLRARPGAEPTAPAAPIGVETAPARGHHAPALPATQVKVPIYRPPRRAGISGPRRRGFIALIAAVIIGAGAAGYLWHRRPATKVRAPQPFGVSAVKLAGPTTALHCPAAVLRLHASVTLHGDGGTLRYDWLLPDGTTSAPQSVTVSAGQTSASITLTYTMSGGGRRHGIAALHMLAPSTINSTPIQVQYLCP